MVAAGQVWTQLVEDLEGTVVENDVSVNAVYRRLWDSVRRLPDDTRDALLAMTLANLLAEGGIIEADPAFMRHLLQKRVKGQ